MVMKSGLMISGCIAAFALATLTMALGAPGANNSTVNQAGNAQKATINQNISHDLSSVDQSNSANTATMILAS